jgi:hypothetical protein
MQPQQQQDPASNDNYIDGRFFWRPELVYDGLIGEPVPLEHSELVLAMRRAERERDALRRDPHGDQAA